MKLYPYLIDAPTYEEGHSTIVVSLTELSQALGRDGTWAQTHEDRQPETFKPSRYYMIVDKIAAGKEIEMPWLYIASGRLEVMDGRHRLYAMIDLGYTDVTIRIARTDAPAVAALIMTYRTT